MTTILVTFLFNFIFVLIFTPLIRLFGVKVGAIDMPNNRKDHDTPTPRIGGLSIVFVLFSSLIIVSFANTHVSNMLVLDKKMALFLFGAMVVFGIGVIDDFHRILPSIKLLFQIVGASLAFLGEIAFSSFNIPGFSLSFGPLDYFLTLFWFLLFINAVNLIDGLDGLASGIVLFVSILMTLFAALEARYFEAIVFAALAGGTLGFLRYNFKPASIFLGDGGSYFLGYMIAGISIIGETKTWVSAAFLIPVLALGVPLFDTLISPLRRFVIGKKLFDPDADHIHHRLKRLGFSTRTAVLLIYVVTLLLCGIAILIINVRNELVGIFILILGIGIVLSFRRLGYSDYFIGAKLSDRIVDLSDDIGLGGDRRIFFDNLNKIQQCPVRFLHA